MPMYLHLAYGRFHTRTMAGSGCSKRPLGPKSPKYLSSASTENVSNPYYGEMLSPEARDIICKFNMRSYNSTLKTHKWKHHSLVFDS